MYDYQYDEGCALVLNDDFPFNINTQLILSFCIVGLFCFTIMLSFMVARCVRERRRRNRSSLRKLEMRKFNKNENYETCAICLDDYEEGDKLRILPCNHGEKWKILTQFRIVILFFILPWHNKKNIHDRLFSPYRFYIIGEKSWSKRNHDDTKGSSFNDFGNH